MNNQQNNISISSNYVIDIVISVGVVLVLLVLSLVWLFGFVVVSVAAIMIIVIGIMSDRLFWYMFFLFLTMWLCMKLCFVNTYLFYI